MKHDVVIVGTGLGGLVCGNILCKHGYNVILLEKNPQIGGCLQSFRRNGVMFDTGMHYVGAMDEGQVMHKLFSYLHLHEDVRLQRLDEDGFEIVSISGEQYKYAMGFDRFADGLADRFPREKDNIREYVQGIRRMAGESSLYNLKEVLNNDFINLESVKTSVSDYISGLTCDKRLQNVLAGTVPLYAGVRGKTPVYIHAQINNQYIQSSYRIVGGSQSIANSLANSIIRMGGAVRKNAEVEEIICNEKHATGVRLKSGEIIQGKYFISDIHPQLTLDMLKTPKIRSAYRERITKLENTISNFTVYIKFKKNTVKYQNYNYFHYNTDDVWSCQDYGQGKFPKNYLYMHLASSVSPEYAEGAIMLSYMHFDEVATWAKTYIGQRGADYEDFKMKKQEQVLDELNRSFPGILSKIENCFSSTPLTYRDYTGTKNGSVYGVLKDKNFPIQTHVSQRTRIPNLFLTGQNINSHGIMGVTMGAIITSGEFLGVNEIIRNINRV